MHNINVLFISGLIMVALFVVLSATQSVLSIIWIYLFLFINYAISSWVVTKTKTTHSTLTLIVVTAVICRTLLIFEQPILSDDVYRYLWDGRVLNHGINPYRYAPSEPNMESLRFGSDYSKINHKQLNTIYPPLAQLIFWLSALLKPTVIMQKVTLCAFDLGIVAVLFRLLSIRGLSSGLVLIYAWNPLVIIEFAHSGHMDSIGIFFLLLGLYLYEKRRLTMSMVIMGCSFLSKFLAIIFVPYVFFRSRHWRTISVFILTVLCVYIPFSPAYNTLFASLFTYAHQWEFNSLVFTSLKGSISDPLLLRSLICLSILVVTITTARVCDDPLRYIYLVVAFGIVVSPTVYPWYVCWLVPFLCFFTNWAWISFSGTVFLSYFVLIEYEKLGTWTLSQNILWVEYAPLIVYLFLAGITRFRYWRKL